MAAAADIERVSIGALAIHVLEFLSGKDPKGTKDEEFMLLPESIRLSVPLMLTPDMYIRMKRLSGPYPKEMVPFMIAHDRYGRDGLIQKQYAEYLRSLYNEGNLDKMMARYTEESDLWRYTFCRVLDVRGIDDKTCTAALKRFTSVETLYVSETTPKEVLETSYPPALSDLCIDGAKNCVEHLMVAKAKGYTGPIRLHNINFDEVSIEELCELLSETRKIDLTGSTFSDEQLVKLLNAMKSVEGVTLDRCQITSFDALKPYKSTLRKLSINQCTELSDGQFVNLKGYANLTELSMRGTQAASHPFFNIREHLPGIRKLDITGCDRIPPIVYTTDACALASDVELIGSLKSWKRVDLSAAG